MSDYRSMDKSKYHQPAYHAEFRQDGWVNEQLPPRNHGVAEDMRRMGCWTFFLVVAVVAGIFVLLADMPW